MSSNIFPNSGSYSYKDLNRYFQTIEETPPDTDLILNYVRHLIQEQPDLQKFHDIESTLSQRIKQVNDQTGLSALASQVSALMHQEMPNSLITHATRDPASVIKILKQESDETLIFNTLLILAQRHPNLVAKAINLLKNPTKSQIFSLAKACVLANSVYGKDEKLLVDILDEGERFILAKECVQADPASVPKNIHYFALSPTHLYELVKECAQSVPEKIHVLINPSYIPSEEERLALAKISMVAFEKSILYLKDFELQNPTDNQQLIDLYASRYPEQFREYCYAVIHPLIIPSEEERKRLAMIAFEANPNLAICNICDFGIQDHVFLMDLITKMAKKFQFSLVDPLFSIDWTTEEANQLFRMLTLTQQEIDLDYLSENLFSDCISALMEWSSTQVALSKIQSNYPKIREFLCQYPDIISELPSGTQKLSLEEAKKCAIAFIGLKAISREKLTTPIQEKDLEAAIMKMIIEGATTPSVFAVIQSHYPIIRDFLSNYKNIVKVNDLPSVGTTLSPRQIKKYATIYLGLKLLPSEKLETKQIDEQDLKIEKIKKKLESLKLVNVLFQKIIKHRNPSQALSYIRLLAYENSPEMMEGLKTGVQMALKMGSQEAYGKPLAPLLIPMLVVAKWAAECHKPELLSQLNQIFREPEVREHYFKAEAAGSDSMAQVWLQTVDLLDKVKELSAERKIQLLTQAAQPITALRDRLLSIQGVIFTGAVQQLDRDFSSSMDDDLKAIILAGLMSDDYLDLKKVDRLQEKYIKTLAALRYPNGWKIYEQRLQETGEEKVQQAYQRFIVSVLNGTFREERYETTSPHIALIREKHESTWQQWQLEDQGKMVKVDGIDYQVKVTDDWEDLLLSGTEVTGSCQRIDGDSYLNKGLQAYLLDGKIRMVAIKVAENDQIYARALLRLMWDEQTQSPVLFLDKKYPEQLSEEVSVALDEYAVAYAKQIGCSLYSHAHFHDELPIHQPLVSLGSCAPYEYADSASISDQEEWRLMPDGEYSITDVYPIWIAV